MTRWWPEYTRAIRTSFRFQHAFPKLTALEDKYGSLIKGQIFGARERKKRGEIAKDRAPKFSFDEGLQVLPDTLAAQLGDSLKLNTPVTKLTQTDDGWRVATASGERKARNSWRGDLLRHGAELARQLTRSSARQCARWMLCRAFSEIRYPPVASVVLGFRREDVAHPCQGFGMLIPKIEGFKILGTIFSSALFPNRAPAGHLTLTSYVGGERYPELALLPPEQLIELTLQICACCWACSGQPVFAHCVVYPQAIPQYNVGYGKYRAVAERNRSRSRRISFSPVITATAFRWAIRLFPA